uniref:Uncharacterized protein n=1 Tax=Knipowitschia caucasica TaxID=637954 RepID=A0AAV2K8B2_KNICA
MRARDTHTVASTDTHTVASTDTHRLIDGSSLLCPTGPMPQFLLRDQIFSHIEGVTEDGGLELTREHP